MRLIFDLKMGERLIEFYGTECVHCKDMEPLIEKLDKDHGIKITRLEVWHDSENAKLLKFYLDKLRTNSRFTSP